MVNDALAARAICLNRLVVRFVPTDCLLYFVNSLLLFVFAFVYFAIRLFVTILCCGSLLFRLCIHCLFDYRMCGLSVVCFPVTVSVQLYE